MRATNVHSNDKLGIVLNQIPAWPAEDTDESRAAAAGVDAVMNRLFTEAVFHGRYPEEVLGYMADFGVIENIDLDALVSNVEAIDFLGVNYYNVNRVLHTPGAQMAAWPGPTNCSMATPPGVLTEMNWGVEPEGLTWMLNRLSNDYPGIPMMIMENGSSYPDEVEADGSINDGQRTEYLQRHIGAIRQAIDDGVDLQGYFTWSLLDNYEWAKGYSKRFGIVHVDFDTMKRTMKQSGHWYKDFLTR